MAGVLFTIAASIGYFVLSLIAQRHAASITTSSMGIEQAPLIVIDTIQGYWWYGYLLLLGLLALQWFIKRVMS